MAVVAFVVAAVVAECCFRMSAAFGWTAGYCRTAYVPRIRIEKGSVRAVAVMRLLVDHTRDSERL